MRGVGVVIEASMSLPLICVSEVTDITAKVAFTLHSSQSASAQIIRFHTVSGDNSDHEHSSFPAEVWPQTQRRPSKAAWTHINLASDDSTSSDQYGPRQQDGPWISKWVQATAESTDIQMPFVGNTGYEHHTDPDCRRTVDPDMALGCRMAATSPWPQVAEQATCIPSGCTACKHQHEFRLQHRPRTSSWFWCNTVCYKYLLVKNIFQK